MLIKALSANWAARSDRSAESLPRLRFEDSAGSIAETEIAMACSSQAPLALQIRELFLEMPPKVNGPFTKGKRTVSQAGAVRRPGAALPRAPCPFRVDTVEKVFWGWRTKFSRAADALRAQRCAGPRRVSEKRPRTFASALGRISTMELSKNQHLRDFWHRSIFDFFNSIGHQRTLARS